MSDEKKIQHEGHLEVMLPAEQSRALSGPVVMSADDPLQSVMTMMQGVLSGDLTEQKVAALDKLTGLMERFEAKRNERFFNEAFVALQREMPKVQANRPVMNSEKSGGGLRYKFAPYEDIMAQVQPFLMKHGFTVSYSQRYDGPRIIVKCVLRHAKGHHVENECAVRIGKGPPGATETQGDGAASTYAKRFALCDALNIVIGKDTDGGQDDDASVDGANITKEQADDFRRRVKAAKLDEFVFLSAAQAGDLSPDSATAEQVYAAYESIPASMWVELDTRLKRKEQRVK
jgi:ERF superfamily